MITLCLQSIRFGIVALTSNVILYLIYLFMTTVGIGPKVAMTFLFAIGVLQTFIFNKRWTFAYQGVLRTSFVKYISVYSGAYMLNLGALVYFVDHLGHPHQVAQGIVIITFAVMIFLLQKFWVFRVPSSKKIIG